jgi:PS-10 peptidase S37
MTKRWALLLLAAACGDNSDPGELTPDATAVVAATCNEATLVDTLKAIPHVAAVKERPCGQYVEGPAKCFTIEFTQPIQHAAPDGKQFGQQLWLMHRGCDRPTLVADWGYSNDLFFDDELAVLFDTNALWIEHRYQGVSLPVAAADWDWTALTIENGADDMHEIITAFRKHYGANFVSTGASKGGITATYHHYFHPKDLDGTIPYVAPASRSPIDPGYQAHLTQDFPPCAQQIRDAQVAGLTTRKTAMLTRLAAEVPPGSELYYLEAIMHSFDWAFWQYYGVTYCNRVPTTATTDDNFYKFFYDFTFGGIRPPQLGTPDDDKSNGALSYEWLSEQGFALQVGEHIRPLLSASSLTTMEENFRDQFPTVILPAYDGRVTHAVRHWAREYGENILFIYGQLDPWSGGAIEQPKRASSARFFVPNATHGAQLVRLPVAERTQALAIASRLFGTAPVMPMMAAAERAGAERVRIIDGKLRQFTAQIAQHRMRH